MDVHAVWIGLLLTAGAVISVYSTQSLVCYFAMDTGTVELLPSQLEGSLCTHIVLIGTRIDNCRIAPSEPTDVSKYYSYIPTWKMQSPRVKVLLSSTGAFGPVLQSEQNRSTFVQTTAPFLRKYGFDGVDLDWEFPSENQKQNFSLILEELRGSFEKESVQTHKNRLLLSVAVSAAVLGIQQVYEPARMNRSVDFINMMSYDFFPFGVSQTGFNSPLFPRSVQQSYAKTVNTAFGANYWASLGMNKAKVMVGIPTYGYSFVLDSPEYHEVGDPASGKLGSIRYSDACNMIRKKFIRVFDDESLVPYLYLNRTWVTYDDLDSVLIKSQWIKESGFGGAMTFDLNADDWQSICDKNTTFPLHRIIKSVLETD